MYVNLKHQDVSKNYRVHKCVSVVLKKKCFFASNDDAITMSLIIIGKDTNHSLWFVNKLIF